MADIGSSCLLHGGPDHVQVSQPEAPFYFTVAELAEYSRIGVNTLYRALRNRELRHACVGQKKIIARKDFESWFKKRTKMALDEFPRPPFALERKKRA